MADGNTSISKLSPMMTHYMELKEKYPDTIMMYRLGDFYEMFFDDAIKASKLLDLTLTGRDCGLAERAPMCGVPYHAVDNYISKLIQSGCKVAICEQLSAVGEQKGMLKRDVIRVITPGTVIEDDILQSNVNNFLVSVCVKNGAFSVAWVDITTSTIMLKDFSQKTTPFELEDFLQSLSPGEIICNGEAEAAGKCFLSIKTGKMVRFSPYYDYAFDFDNAKATILKHFSVFDLSVFGIDGKLSACAAGALIDYINATQKRSLTHINKLDYVRNGESMFLDFNTKRNLELFETMSDKKKHGSLLWVLDQTKTAVGARMLRTWIDNPLQSVEKIEKRQQAIGELIKNGAKRASLMALMTDIRDIERLVTKISYGSIMPKEILALKVSLLQIPKLKEVTKNFSSEYLKVIYNGLNPLESLTEKLESAISEDAPTLPKDGNIFKKGFDAELDKIRDFRDNSKDLVEKYEQKEKTATNIPLRVRYNRIFGYYIEVPRGKGYDEQLPSTFVRKQTVANAERYSTPELEKLQYSILSSEDDALKTETALYEELKNYLVNYIKDLQLNSYFVAYLDCLLSLSSVAADNGYVKPKIGDNVKHIKISGGRHPVVEKLMKANEFVANDTLLDSKDNLMMIITGPNMAGKSTYIRQVAILTLMAHIGSFVPASSAEFSIVDRIFTRVGASDNMVQGQSTFMVEMLEVANILNYATPRSLLVLDEIGRGTSTLDGLSIAWAIVEHIITRIRAKSLFATHYHELTELESLMDGVKNYHILIQEIKGTIAFIYKICRGSASKSYGIEVASLAGISKDITSRAKDIMNILEQTHELSGNLEGRILNANSSSNSVAGTQMSFFNDDPAFEEVKKILDSVEINKCMPIEALTILSELKKIIRK